MSRDFSSEREENITSADHDQFAAELDVMAI